MSYVVGVDEAGRGPLAGPVAVGVVKCNSAYDILEHFPGLADSKKLSEKKREALFLILQEEIRKGNVDATVRLSSAARIDAKGIAPAIAHAVSSGVQKLLPNPEDGTIFLDGSLRAPKEYRQKTIIGGDNTVPAIMLAAIAAKVTRDRFMKKLHETYPEYGFAVHKGYGTKAHFEALRAHGPSPVHRRSFLKSLATSV